MGCTPSKVRHDNVATTTVSATPDVAEKIPKLYWLNGYPCTGKTFLADYLATQGWCMVDGDYKNYSSDPKDAETWATFYQAFEEYWTKPDRTEMPPEEMWKPHHEDLIRLAKEGLDQGKDVVVAFVAYKRHVRDWLRGQLPSVKFVNIEVSVEMLVNRFYERGLKAVEQMGMSMQQYWDSEENAPYKAAYGEYSRDVYDKFVRESYFVGFEPFDESEADCFTVDNNDFTDNKSIKQLNELVGILDEPKVDVSAIEAVQMARYAKMAGMMGGEDGSAEEK